MTFTPQASYNAFKQAVELDDAQGIVALTQQGADVNAQDISGVTPVMLAVGKFKLKALSALLELQADPNIKDKPGNNAVILAVQAYKKNPDMLEMVLNAGGDPNTLKANDNPIITYFLNNFNQDGVGYLIDKGADVNSRNRREDPIVLAYALTDAWDNVWTLLQAGAKFDYKDERISWEVAFRSPHIVSPGSPIWPYKVKVWRFLQEHDMVVPYNVEALVDQQFYDYMDKHGYDSPTIEELEGEAYEAYAERVGLDKIRAKK